MWTLRRADIVAHCIAANHAYCWRGSQNLGIALGRSESGL